MDIATDLSYRIKQRKKYFCNSHAMIPWGFTQRLPYKGKWTLDESDRFCSRATTSHYENFPVIAGIAGRDARRTLAAVYCFARIADDFADEPAFEGVRLRLLDEWQLQLEECLRGVPARHPVFVSLSAAVERHNLDPGMLLRLLGAFRQDCTKERYESLEELLDYCSRSANPVGRIVLRVMRKDTPEAEVLSDKTCTSLQLINFWQDLSVDRVKNRLYIPRDVASRHGVELDSVARGSPPAGFRDLLDELAAVARSMMLEARRLPELVGFPGEFYLRAVQEGGLSILGVVEEMGTRILYGRPSLTFLDMAAIFARSAKETAGRRLGLY
jgi:squalene synthase HpnC